MARAERIALEEQSDNVIVLPTKAYEDSLWAEFAAAKAKPNNSAEAWRLWELIGKVRAQQETAF